MRRLMLLRHAKTENDAPSGKDQDRRLDERGRLDAAEIGSWMARHPPFPDSVLVSPAVAGAQISLEMLHAFEDEDGALPAGALIQATDGNFYGTTPEAGGSGLGTVFQMRPDRTFTVLHDFTGGADGFNPYSALVLGASNTFYSTTLLGGTSNLGTVFKLIP